MFRKIILFVSCSAGLSLMTGCAGMADATSKMAGLGVVSQEESTFDGATIVEVSPNHLHNPDSAWGNNVKLGARWSSKAPEFVALVLSYSSSTSGGSVYLNLNDIDINVNGKIESFAVQGGTNRDSSSYNTVSNTIYTESKNSVVIPYSLLEKMMAADDCRLRIHTSDGYQDSIFTTERITGGQGTAKLSIKEFMARISAAKQKS